MADSEIEILITAVDDASKTLKTIEKNVEDTAKNSEKATISLGEAFTKVQGAMLNLGQAAQQVHNIFEIYQNKTRILENATDRLENAQLRLKQATNDLATAHKKVSDIVEKASRDNLTLEGAQLSLEASQRNLTEAINEYGAGSLEARQAMLDVKTAQLDLTDAQKLGQKRLDEMGEAIQGVKDKEDALIVANNGVERAQRSLEKALGDAKWMYIDMGVQIVSAIGSLGTFIATIWKSVPALYAAAGGFLSITIAGAPLWAIILAITAAVAYVIFLWKNWETLSGTLKTAMFLLSPPLFLLVDALKSIMKWLEPVIDGFKTLLRLKDKNNVSHQSRESDGVIYLNDFIMSNGKVYKTNPQDVITGTKYGKGGGMTININGDNYGVNGNDIANNIMTNLRRTIRI